MSTFQTKNEIFKIVVGLHAWSQFVMLVILEDSKNCVVSLYHEKEGTLTTKKFIRETLKNLPCKRNALTQ